MTKAVTIQEIRDFVRPLGVEQVRALAVEKWKSPPQPLPGTSPREVWPLTETILVLALTFHEAAKLPNTNEYGLWKVQNNLLDTCCYRLCLRLNSMGFASVNIPVDTDGSQGDQRRTIPVLDHNHGALLAGFPRNIIEEKRFLFATVLTAARIEDADVSEEAPRPGPVTKEDLLRITRNIGVYTLGIAPAERWKDKGVIEETLPGTRSIILMAAPMWLPLIEATPSVLGREQVFVTDKLLAKAAYAIETFLNRRGWASKEMVQDDGFSLAQAGRCAGLGTIGWNGRLLSPEYGPRIRLRALAATAPIPGDPVPEGELCLRCGNCRKLCPAGALNSEGRDVNLCKRYSRRLARAYCDCAACIKACPLGRDREVFAAQNTDRYFAEEEALHQVPVPDPYRGWAHIRKHGRAEISAVPLDDEDEKA
jgi:epoxyqueuosine reductase QueG